MRRPLNWAFRNSRRSAFLLEEPRLDANLPERLGDLKLDHTVDHVEAEHLAAGAGWQCCSMIAFGHNDTTTMSPTASLRISSTFSRCSDPRTLFPRCFAQCFVCVRIKISDFLHLVKGRLPVVVL